MFSCRIKAILLSQIIFVVVILSGCSGKPVELAGSQYSGSYTATFMEWSEFKDRTNKSPKVMTQNIFMSMDFDKNTVKLVVKSPFVGESKNKTVPYSIQGDSVVIESEKYKISNDLKKLTGSKITLEKR